MPCLTLKSLHSPTQCVYLFLLRQATTISLRSTHRSKLTTETYHILWVVRIESVRKTYILHSTNGHTMIRAVSQPFTAEASVRSQVSPCHICGGQSEIWIGLPRSTTVLPSQYNSSSAPFSSWSRPCSNQDTQVKIWNLRRSRVL
jgi:hypothetical protein